MEALEECTRSIDGGFGVEVVYLDYPKAFDTVPIRGSYRNCKDIGIRGKVLIGYLSSSVIEHTKGFG